MQDLARLDRVIEQYWHVLLMHEPCSKCKHTDSHLSFVQVLKLSCLPLIKPIVILADNRIRKMLYVQRIRFRIDHHMRNRLRMWFCSHVFKFRVFHCVIFLKPGPSECEVTHQSYERQ